MTITVIEKNNNFIHEQMAKSIASVANNTRHIPVRLVT